MSKFSLVLCLILSLCVYTSAMNTNWMFDGFVEKCNVNNSPCPPTNQIGLSFYINGTGTAPMPVSAPSFTISAGDTIQFTLPNGGHPLMVCVNSNVFCTGTAGTSNALAGPITAPGSSIMVSFPNAGTYFYGCNLHFGMGGTITVVNPTSKLKILH